MTVLCWVAKAGIFLAALRFGAALASYALDRIG